MNAEAKRVPRDLTRSIHNPDSVNNERACLLLYDQFEVVTNQLDDDTQGIMLFGLL